MNEGNLSTLVHPKTALRDGKFIFPNAVNHIRIDIGLSTHASHSAWFLDLYKDRGAIGIEPDPRCCEELMHGSDLLPEVKRIVLKKQAIRHHSTDIGNLDSRFVLVHCAISDVSVPTQVPFYLTDAQLAGGNNQHRVFGTSSLHMPTSLHPAGGYTIQNVLAVPLREIIAAIPDRFMFIEEIKVDTEGHDYQVLKSAGELIKKAVFVTVESGGIAPTHHHGVVVDATNSTRSVIQEYMDSMGFRIDYEDATDQRYINVHLEHLVKLYGLNTNGDPLILAGKSSPLNRLRFMAKKLARNVVRNAYRIWKN
jgi:hypothetical protein